MDGSTSDRGRKSGVMTERRELTGFGTSCATMENARVELARVEEARRGRDKHREKGRDKESRKESGTT